MTHVVGEGSWRASCWNVGWRNSTASQRTEHYLMQVRHPITDRPINGRKLAEGKSPKEALRCLKRRLSDAVYRCLVADQCRHRTIAADGATVP